MFNPISQTIIRKMSCLNDYSREGWDITFASMHEHGDDQLLDQATETAAAWDREEWEW